MIALCILVSVVSLGLSLVAIAIALAAVPMVQPRDQRGRFIRQRKERL